MPPPHLPVCFSSPFSCSFRKSASLSHPAWKWCDWNRSESSPSCPASRTKWGGSTRGWSTLWKRRGPRAPRSIGRRNRSSWWVAQELLRWQPLSPLCCYRKVLAFTIKTLVHRSKLTRSENAQKMRCYANNRHCATHWKPFSNEKKKTGDISNVCVCVFVQATETFHRSPSYLSAV